MLTKQQALAHVAKVEFKLKDYEKTRAKYANYKTSKRLELELNFAVTYELEQWKNDVEYSIAGSYNYAYELSKKLTTKANIRQFKTIINSKMYEAIKNHIDWYTEEMQESKLNDNELRSFTTRMYIENYTVINTAMQEMLQEYVAYCYE